MMKNTTRSGWLVAAAALLQPAAFAQVPVAPAPDHAPLLASSDAKLAANKRLVYDFYREVLEGGHMDLAEKYVTENYVQHNPLIATGRAGLVETFSKRVKPAPIEPRTKSKLVAITAEADRVTLASMREYDDPSAPGTRYTTTWFDMFRIENGRIVEHWDSTIKH